MEIQCPTSRWHISFLPNLGGDLDLLNDPQITSRGFSILVPTDKTSVVRLCPTLVSLWRTLLRRIFSLSAFWIVKSFTVSIFPHFIGIQFAKKAVRLRMSREAPWTRTPPTALLLSLSLRVPLGWYVADRLFTALNLLSLSSLRSWSVCSVLTCVLAFFRTSCRPTSGSHKHCPHTSRVFAAKLVQSG